MERWKSTAPAVTLATTSRAIPQQPGAAAAADGVVDSATQAFCCTKLAAYCRMQPQHTWHIPMLAAGVERGVGRCAAAAHTIAVGWHKLCREVYGA